VHSIWYLEEVCASRVAIAGRDMIIRSNIKGSVVNTRFLTVSIFGKIAWRERSRELLTRL
jgi:hypothetical protein